MEYRNPSYTVDGHIDCEINHPVYGWIPFTASPDDPEQLGRDIFEEASQGDVDPYVPIIPTTEETIVKNVTESPDDLFGGPTTGELFNG